MPPDPPAEPPRLALVASSAERAQAALAELATRYDAVGLAQADIVVTLGGDGLLLDTLHRLLDLGLRVPVYGMNRGTTGWLLNPYDPDGLPDRLAGAHETSLSPLRLSAWDTDGAPLPDALAFNEVALRRLGNQSARVRVGVDGVERLADLRGDGVLVATPAGSTAYNLSAHGPIVPLDAGLLALTPICPLTPRRWPGALLPHDAVVRFDVLEAAKRPVAASADQRELVEVGAVEVRQEPGAAMTVLFDRGRALEERVIAEQFLV